jgi:hypothetical protein
MNRRYYGERSGKATSRLGLRQLVGAFQVIYSALEKECYFQEALGYECVHEGRVYGSWGQTPEAFVMLHVLKDGLWPIEKRAIFYDEFDLFSMIEFLYDYVSMPKEGEYHSFNDCGWHYRTFDKKQGQDRYRNEVNRFLGAYRGGYELSIEGEVRRKSPPGMEDLLKSPSVSGEPESIDDRVNYAISKFLHYDSGLPEKKDAVRTLADVLEYLRKSEMTLSSKDDDNLFQIINGFDIRHHNKDQQGEYDKEVFYEWMFYTFLASIRLIVEYRMKTDQPIL